MMYKKSIFFAIVVSITGFILGYDMGISGGTINYLSTYFNLGSSAQGFALSIYIIGAAFGSLLTHKLNDKYGRKDSLKIGTIILLVSSILLYMFGTKFELFLIIRFFAGVGMGLLFSTAPILITEISPAKIRGILGSLIQLTTGVGIIAGYFFTLMLSKTVTDINFIWFYAYASEIAIILVYLILLFFIVESPIWLVLKNKIEDAQKIMTTIWPDIDAKRYINEHISVHNSLNDTKDEEKKIKAELKRTGKLKLLLFIAFFLSALNQLSGINPIIYYSDDIFKMILHSGTSSDFLYSVLNGLFFALGAVFSILTIEKFGRKVLLISGISIMFLSLLIIGTFIYNDYYSYFLIFLIYLFIFSYNFSSGTMRFLYLGELTPSQLRTSTLGFAGFVNWAADFLVSWSLPILSASVFLNMHLHGSFIYFLYAIFCFIFVILVFNLPETKGKELHEIAVYWKLEEK